MNCFETYDGIAHLMLRRYKELVDFGNRRVSNIRIQERSNPKYGEEFRAKLIQTDKLTWGMCEPNSIKDCNIDFEKFWDINVLSVANVLFIVSAVPIHATGLKLLPSPTRDTILETEELRMRDKWLRMLKGEPTLYTAMFIYENTLALPRFF